MLPPLLHQSYGEFQQLLQQLHAGATNPELEVAVLQSGFQDVKGLFESQIANLNGDDLPPDDTSRWQSVQTEIRKQMRLLETDMMFLQVARSSATLQTRLVGVCDRLNTLIQYCQALL